MDVFFTSECNVKKCLFTSLVQLIECVNYFTFLLFLLCRIKARTIIHAVSVISIFIITTFEKCTYRVSYGIWICENLMPSVSRICEYDVRYTNSIVMGILKWFNLNSKHFYKAQALQFHITLANIIDIFVSTDKYLHCITLKLRLDKRLKTN